MTVTFRWNGPAATATIRDAATRGLRDAAEHVLAESTKVVPLEEGTLSKSGATSVDAATLTATVSYDTPYAVRQHEELDYRHDEGRQAKYLEQPLNENRDTIARIIGDEIGKALR